MMNHVPAIGTPAARPSGLQTFVELCSWRAQQFPGRPAFSFLADNGQDEHHLSYAELDERVRAIAAVLQDHGRRGERVLIVQQPGLDYVVSLYACMYAGMVAVPVYPPDPFRIRQTLPRLQVITEEAGARVMLSSREILGDRVGPLWHLCRDAALPTEEISSAEASHWTRPQIGPDDLALLQYTSGSTGTPRGVALTHRNLLANAEQGYHAFDVADAVCVFWLPPYHDLGLVGGILIPMFGGRHSVLLSPLSFVREPLRWFRAIDRFRGTTSASPNFGYEWCLRKISPEQCEGLDLSSWQLAAVGAEPVRARTLRRFAQQFSGTGFSASAFTPGYGMAEATLAITSKPVGSPPVIQRFDAEALQQSPPIAIASQDEGAVSLVSSGTPVRGCTVRIVDPATSRPVSDGTVGEIWVHSPSVAQGYWQHPDWTAASFDVALAGAKEASQQAGRPPGKRYLRTGDLGFLKDDQLFVSGRIKEQIILAGRNYFPHDIESAIQQAHEAFRVDGGVAFSVDHPDGERLVIVHEVVRPKRFNLSELERVVRRTLVELFDLTPQEICLVAASSLPKTSSGKLRRLECRRQYLEDELRLLHAWKNPAVEETSLAQTSAADETDHEDESRWTQTQRELAPLWCEVLDLPRAKPAQDFLEMGGHSLAASRLLILIRDHFEVSFEFADLFRSSTLGQIAQTIDERRSVQDRQAVPAIAETADTNHLPLTGAQQGFWLLDQMGRQGAFLNLGVSFILRGSVDVAKLAACCKELPQHFPALRARFSQDEVGRPFQALDGPQELPVTMLDLRDRTPVERQHALERLRYAAVRQSFDPTRPPLMHITLARMTQSETQLVLTANHLVCDGWSLMIIAQHLAMRYAGQPLTSDRSDYIRALMRRRIEDDSARMEMLREYWQNRLEGVPAQTALAVMAPGDAARSGEASDDASKVVRHRLSETAVNRLDAYARQQRVTPMAVLVTLWHHVLEHYCGTSDLVLGIVTDNRRHAGDERTVGCFINTIPFRTNILERDALHADNSIADRIRRMHHRWLDDVSHGDVATQQIVDWAQIDRASDRMPLVQHLILHQPAPHDHLLFRSAEIAEYITDYSSLGAYDTSLIYEPHGAEAELAIAHSARRIDGAVVNNMLAALARALDAVTGKEVSTIGVIPYLADEEYRRIRRRLTGKRSSLAGASFMERFAACVEEMPQAPAVIDADGTTSFAALDERSAHVAAALRGRGIRAGDVVAIHTTPTTQTLDVLLGLWKIGAAYLPLDPTVPPSRTRTILEDACPAGIIYGSAADEDAALTSISIKTIAAESLLGNAHEPRNEPRQFGARSVTNDSAAIAYLIYTSGSTGAPKGVVVEHGNVANLLSAFADSPGLRSGERMLASTSLSFDISVLELFLPLYVGATTCIAPASLSAQPDRVISFVAQHTPNVIQGTPSSFNMLLSAGWRPGRSTRIWCGGEPLHGPLAGQLLQHAEQLWNVYGPTETTVWSLTHRVSPESLERISIGRPVNNTTLRIVDAQGRDVPEGVVGELWIGGVGVARGYWNRPAATQDRFITDRSANPATAAGASLLQDANTATETPTYRTGDWVCLDADGTLEFRGRVDRQVKLRGHRIELDEIEAHLTEHDAIAQAAVTLVPMADDEARIVAFVSYRPGVRIEPSELRDPLARALPSVMIPSAIIPLDHLPHTSAGKIDYQNLPVSECLTDQVRPNHRQQDRIRPRDQVEQTIAEIWREVLGTSELGVEDNFFDLGGHSLAAARVFARIQSSLSVRLPLQEIYQHPTVAALATQVRQRLADSEPTPAAAAGLATAECAEDASAPSRASDAVHDCRPGQTPGPNRYLLSRSEQRLWFVDQLEPNHPFYNLPLAARVSGPLDVDLLGECINRIVDRHETLRSTYHLVDGRPQRRIAERVEIQLKQVDLSEIRVGDPTNDDRLLHQHLTSEARRPFVLDSGPLLRVAVHQLDPTTHVILLVMHHIVSDGWSMAVFMDELESLYQSKQLGIEAPLEPLKITYCEYAARQQRELTDERLEDSLRFWQRTLGDSTETLDLPTDFDRPLVQDFAGATLPLTIPREVSQRVHGLAKESAATPFMVLLATYGILLARYAGQKDFNVGTAVANRPDPSLEDLIGFFVGTLVLRLQVPDEQTFSQWLQEVRRTTTEALEHQQVPFERIVERLVQQRDRHHSPLFQVALVLQNTPRDFKPAPGLSLEPLPIDNGTAKHDLTLILWEQDGRFTGHFEYRSGLFRRETIARMRDSFLTLLSSAVESADRQIEHLPTVPPDTAEAILHRSIGPITPDEQPQTLHQLFIETATRVADSLAVTHHDTVQTYAELERMSARIARGLQTRGVGLGSRVMLYMARSPQQIATQLAVMRCGGAFIPVDASIPVSRVEAIARDVEAIAVVVDQDSVPVIADGLGGVETWMPRDLARSDGASLQHVEVTPDDLAYLIYTSGSTGNPKGVQIEHRAICNFVRGFCERVGLSQSDRILHHLSPSFDGALAETYTAFSVGAAVQIADRDEVLDPRRLTELMRSRETTFIGSTPHLLASLHPEDVPNLRKVVSAGAALTWKVAEAWMPGRELFNGYGPTECAVGAAIHRVLPGAGKVPPVGRPLRNMRIYILDQNLRMVPDGVVGEVYIGGDSVGRGYWKMPQQTAARFVPDPFACRRDSDNGKNSRGSTDESAEPDAARMYRTGDLGRWNSDGNMELIGRSDEQIKLRGFRIEPGEIASVMNELPQVRASQVVIARDGASESDKRLVAYFVPETLQGQNNRDVAGQQAPSANEQEHVSSWLNLFDQAHQRSAVASEPENDFSGWQSVIAGRPIPKPLMQQWADESARRILALQPRSVLEIGCGTGLMLLRLGDGFERYVGLDVLPSAIDQLKRTLHDRVGLSQRVELHRRAADELDGWAAGSFDTIVLNSVVQYFPTLEYLMLVLEKAVRLLAPGGRIFVGDLRDLRLAGSFALEVEMARPKSEAITAAEMRRRVAGRVERDEELMLDPRLFAVLKDHIPRLADVRVQSKTGPAENELNRYRYDVSLYFDQPNAQPVLAQPAIDNPALDRDGSFRIEYLMWCWMMNSDGSATLGDARAELQQWVCDRGPSGSGAAVRRAIGSLKRPDDPFDPADRATWTNNPLRRRESLKLVSQIRNHLRSRLPDYMIPSAFVPLAAMPLTVQGKLDVSALPPPPTGRPQWAGQATTPRNADERLLVAVWEELLDVQPVGVEDDFFELGGHSMLAVRMVAEVEKRTGVELPLAALFQRATVGYLAERLRRSQSDDEASVVLPLSGGAGAEGTSAVPLFCIHPAGGTVFCYRELAEHFAGDRPVYGLQAQGIDGRRPPHTTMAEMAGCYAEAIRNTVGSGPCHLAGWSLGGNIAFEVARHLEQRGTSIGTLALLDSGRLSATEPLSESDFLPLIAAIFPADRHVALDDLREWTPQEQLDYFVQQASKAGIVPAGADGMGRQILDVFQANIRAVHEHEPGRYSGAVTLVRPAQQARTGALFDDEALGWRELAATVSVAQVSGDHAHMLQGSAADEIANLLRAAMRDSDACMPDSA